MCHLKIDIAIASGKILKGDWILHVEDSLAGDGKYWSGMYS